MEQRTQKRVLVIGLAEATLDLIKPWAENGRLPTFERLMTNGASGRLRSQIPPITPQMWGTIVTGRSPGYHGTFDFWQRGPDGRFREINGSDLREPPIWQLLSERQVCCGIVNIPFTYPPARINGFMISGEDAPGPHPSIASPNALYHEVTRRFGRYRLKDIFPGGRQKADYLTLVEEDIEKQTDVLEYLLSTKKWELAMIFFSATAITQHYFWADMASEDPDNPYRDVILTAYRSLDRAIDRLCKVAGPETVIFLISECGAGPLRSGVQMNTLLQQNGLLFRKRESAGSRSRRLVAEARKKAQGYLQRWLPNTLYYRANNNLKGLKVWIQSYLADSDIDWTRTKAFCRGKEGDIFINLKSRDPHGIVEPGVEYEATRDQIIDCFASLVDPATGERAVDRVYRAEELYQGPMLDWAPDLVVAWRDTAYMPTENDKDKDSVFVARWREYMNWPTSGGHRLDGVLIAHGPGIRKGSTIDGARIIDLMPTWLQCLGQPIPADLEGRVIAELFEPAHGAQEQTAT